MMITDDIINFNEDKSFRFNKIFNQNNVESSKLFSNLKHLSSFKFSDIIKVIELKIRGNITYRKRIPGVLHENVVYRFKKPHKIELKYNLKGVEIYDKRFDIIVSTPLNESDRIVDDYCEYFAFKYNEYVINPNNDRLSKGALNLAKMMGDRLEYVRSEKNSEVISQKRI